MNDIESFSIIFWNAGGLNENKLLAFEHLLSQHEVDVFAIVDAGSFIENEDNIIECFKDFQIYTKSRDRKISSGMIIGTRRQFPCTFQILKTMTKTDKLEAVSLIVWKGEFKIPCIAIYNPPNNSGDFSKIEIDENTLCFGDFNCKSERWGFPKKTEAARKTEASIDTNNLIPIESERPGDYTYLSADCSKSTLDLVLAHSNIAESVTQSSIGLLGAFGHKVIKIEVAINCRVCRYLKSSSWNFENANWDLFRRSTSEMITDKKPRRTTIATEKHITKTFLECAEQSILKQDKLLDHQPFWSEKLSKLSEERYKALAKLEVQNSYESKNKLRSCQKKLEAELCKANDAKFKDNFKNFLKNLKTLDCQRNGFKDFWEILGLNEFVYERWNSVIDLNGKLLTSNSKKAQAFVEYYAEATSGDSIVLKARSSDVVENFTEEEFQDVIASLNSEQTSDELYIDFFRNIEDQTVVVTLDFINLVLSKGIPTVWRKYLIIPVLKSNKNADKLSSYRPVAVPSLLCQIYESMLLKRLNQHLKTPIALDQATFLCQRIQDGFNAKLTTLAVFVDFRCAYNLISHKILLQKLINVETPSYVVNAVRDLLHQRVFSVQCHDQLSPDKQLKRGLPFDSVLNQTLLSVLVSDAGRTVEKVSGIKTIYHVEDLVIFISGKDLTKLHRVINEALKELEKWTDRNEISINQITTKYQLFMMSNSDISFLLNFGEHTLEKTENQSYLGLSLDRKLTFMNHAEQQAKIARSRLDVLTKLTMLDLGCSRETLASTYKLYILPVITFREELLICAKANVTKKLQAVHNIALRIITGRGNTAAVADMEHDADIKDLQLSREDSAIKMFDRVVKDQDSLFWNYTSVANRLESKKSFINRVLHLRSLSPHA